MSFELENIGLCVNPSCPHLGASSDASSDSAVVVLGYSRSNAHIVANTPPQSKCHT